MLIRLELDRDSALIVSYFLGSAREWWCKQREDAFPPNLEELLRFAEIAKTGRTEPDTDEHDDAGSGNSGSDELQRKTFYTQHEAGVILDRSERTIRRWNQSGKLARTVAGIPRSELERLKGRTHART